MKNRNYLVSGVLAVSIIALLSLYGCSPQKTEPVRPVKIADGDIDPANWGKALSDPLRPLEKDRGTHRSGKEQV